MSGNKEVFSRILIDQCLKDSGWNLLDNHQVRFTRVEGDSLT